MTFVRLPSETLTWKSYSWAPSQATGFLWTRVARAVSWEGPCHGSGIAFPLLTTSSSHAGWGLQLHLQPEIWKMNEMLLEILTWHWFTAGQKERTVSGKLGCFGSPWGRCQGAAPLLCHEHLHFPISTVHEFNNTNSKLCGESSQFSSWRRPLWNNICFIWYSTTIKLYVDSKVLEEFHIPLQNLLRFCAGPRTWLLPICFTLHKSVKKMDEETNSWLLWKGR